MEKYDTDREKKKTVVVGLDVHKDTISACVFDPASGELCHERTFKNESALVRRFIQRVRRRCGEPTCCYEASSCGFVLYRFLRKLDISCEVIAPSSMPRRARDRIKNDRRDAEKLATLYAAGLLTAVRIPDEDEEAVRSLLRCRVALVEELTRTRHRTTQFLQTRGLIFRGGSNWGQRFWAWLSRIDLGGSDQVVLETYLHLMHYLEGEITALESRLKEEAQTEPFRETVRVLSAFRGVALITALTLAAEIGDIRRFAHPRQRMAYLGLVPSEYSSGSKTVQGPITKSGNRHARKAVVSAAWKYTYRPARGHPLKRRQEAVNPAVVAISWKAQLRLYKRFHALAFRKPRSVAAVAVARELVGFLWEAMQTLQPAVPLAQVA
jgi:transposase